MIPSDNRGWQTTIADLALILFMISAAALAQGGDAAAIAAPPAPETENPLPATSEPVAIYRAGEGMPSLNDWLAGQAPDTRLQLTIIARYSPERADDAATAALQLADAARVSGWQPRVMLEPGNSDDVVAVLGYDSGGDVAR